MVSATPFIRGFRPLLGLLAAATLAACGGQAVQPTEPSSAALEGPVVEQRWNLLLVGTDERLSMPETPWFEVDRNGRVSGSDGCNRITGQVRLGEKQRIEFSELAATRRDCSRQADARRVTGMLETAYRYLIDHDRLVFFGPDQRVLGGWRKAPGA